MGQLLQSEIDNALVMASSTTRFSVFLELVPQMDDFQYWKTLSDVYTICDNNFKHRFDLKSCFGSERKGRELLMSEKAEVFFKNLPNEIEIYRGMTYPEFESKTFGISWTLNVEIANYFAFKYGRNYDTANFPKMVAKGFVLKSDVLAYFNERNEDEIITLNPQDVSMYNAK